MSVEPKSAARPLNPIIHELVRELVHDAGTSVRVLRGVDQSWLTIEETSSASVFVEAIGDLLCVVPFVGDDDVLGTQAWVRSIGPSRLDGEQELVIDAAALASDADGEKALGRMRAALTYWTRSAAPSEAESVPAPPASDSPPVNVVPDMDLPQVDGPAVADEVDAANAQLGVAQLAADVSQQWSWASSAARIPQISDLTVALSEAVEHVQLAVVVRDADIQFGATTVFDGPLPAGTKFFGGINVALSARVMSQIEVRTGAECIVTLVDRSSGRVLARIDEAIDIQPRDLWLWGGDPRRNEQQARLKRRHDELARALQDRPDHPDASAIESELQNLADLHRQSNRGTAVLARSLLASFVRPNHPEIAAIAREAAGRLGTTTGDPSFFAFQIPDVAEAEQRADATVTSIYEALQARSIAYSDPPPGWDYTNEGQRIRDHGDVARGGLGTCMDTTVLMAAVIEQVGLLPALVLIPGHIFVGYWRRNPLAGQGPTPEWYPDTAVVRGLAKIQSLVEGGWLGIIETTAFTEAKLFNAHQARLEARYGRLDQGFDDKDVTLIDVVAARAAGVSPLPAVNERPDGVTEIIEYRPGHAPAVTEVEPKLTDPSARQRHVDNHPTRYRTWKSSLFSLNATNALLNLPSNARVQPLVLPPEGLGLLEDKLNQDASFGLHSGYDVPEVWRARDIHNAVQLLGSSGPDDRRELTAHMHDRRIYVQRIGRSGGRDTLLTPPTFVKELRSMAHNAKTARDERGMNPLFLCLGTLRWPYKPGVFARAPLILVPVNISVGRGRQEFILSLDSAQQTTPNAALIEWLRREHGLSIPGLVEPLSDRSGIDVDGVLAEVRQAVSERGLSIDVAADAYIATLDLSAFRMWQDLNRNADSFLGRPLVRHLVHTPTEQFEDPAIRAAGEAAGDGEMTELEKLDTPIPADSTQKRAVLWARQRRTFVLQGPPGTGKSQTITNMVAECLLSGQRVLFVAEKGTALAVVQRRLEAIGLGPFTLNLHHEGSNATEVRAQLKRALTVTVMPDRAAMDSAHRRLRNARFDLTQYPSQLHEPNAAGLSAYSAHDELLVLDDGPALPVPAQLLTSQVQIEALRDLFQNLQQWTASAGVRPDHPWRLAGGGAGDPFDVGDVSRAVRGVLDGAAWAKSTDGALREALADAIHPAQLRSLAAAANRVLPRGDELVGVLSPQWPTVAAKSVDDAKRAVEGAVKRLHGFSPDILSLDLHAVARQLQEATASGIFGRKKRQAAALAPLAAESPQGLEPTSAPEVLADLIAVQDTAAAVRSGLSAVPGLRASVPEKLFYLSALTTVEERVDELVAATAGIRDGAAWTQRVQALAQNGHLAGHTDSLSSFATAWQQLWGMLLVNESDFQAWRGDHALGAATELVRETWRRHVDHERLLPLQHWCTLVRRLEPLREAGLDTTRVELLEGRLPAYVAEDALERGVAQASLKERVAASGLDRFNAVAHDQRVGAYSEAQADVRRQWVTDGPAQLVQRRGGGAGLRTGGLARELEKTTRRLGTRPILRKYAEAVQELTPLVLCSPSSVVDLIEPGVMEFDVVIFDEASQITVPEAVGALGRCRAAIVVGDSKQMPPTRTISSGNVDEDLDDPDADEVVEDQESILSEFELARVPTLTLNWHYRSQDEALIAFSNRAYYRGDLSSFPTPTLMSSETGVEFRRINGQYLRAGSAKVDVGHGIVAGNNTNPAEAIAIVKAIHELVHAGIKLPSVGIVTFNEQQRQLIDDLLMVATDPRVADVMDESKMGRGEALFVKALEQVQGDERDIIIFSVAFSKQANGKIPTNFGPLSNSGGERRLNVGVTRARRKNIVFCSFEPAELDVSGSSYIGPKDLKDFLTFAKASGGSQEPGETAQRVAVRDRHRDDIASALVAAGLHVMSDVGLSNFRLDLVLARPDHPEQPILPVLLDGESWRKRSTVSDRDVLPVEVLRNLMGWPTVARIWWPMWLQNRQEVIDRVLAEVDRAEAALNAGLIDQAVDTPPTVDADPVETSAAPHSDDVARLVTLPDPPSADDLTLPVREAEPTEGQSPEDPSVVGLETVRPIHEADHSESSSFDGVLEFVAAHANVVGSKEILDALPERSAAAIVREQLLDVIEAEGPVGLARLAKIVGRRFGFGAVRTARAAEIARLVPPAQLRKSRKLGDFAWPISLDPETWTGFRTAGGRGGRTLDEIAPEEIANAILTVVRNHPGLGQVDLLRQTAELFGIARLGANVRTRLEAVHAKLPTDVDTAGSEEIPAPDALSPHADAPTTDTAPIAIAVRASDPVVDRLTSSVDQFVPDLGRVDDDLYYDFVARHPLNADLKRLVNEIVLDPEYDGSPGHKGVENRARHLNIDDAHAVGNSASMVWRETVGIALEQTASEITVHLAQDPEFEPLPWQEDIDAFVAERLSGRRRGLVTLVQRQLNLYAEEQGLVARLEEKIKADARSALLAMTPLDRDAYGFTSRNAKRAQLAEPHISSVKESQRKFVIYWMSRFQGGEIGLERDARYATAIRALNARGETRASSSRILGISTSLMDRITRENRHDVALLPDDPILTELAPSLLLNRNCE